jgi:hypothetical protein
MIQNQGKKEPLKLSATADGLHLEGSILWFDAQTSGQLSFLSSALNPSVIKVPQVIATEETIKIIELFRERPNALICQYNRPFSIGRLKMELLPSGSVLGGASLFVETDKARILYSPSLQTQSIPTVRQMQLKKADTLILNAHLPEPKLGFPNRRKEKERLVSRLKACLENNQIPVLLCPAIGTAQELCHFLSEHNIPVAVNNSILKVNKIYEAYGSQLGSYSTYYPKRTKNKVVILPLPLASSLPSRKIQTIPGSQIFFVRNYPPIDDLLGLFDQKVETFCIGQTSEAAELKEVAIAVKPKEIYFIGDYAKSYVDEFKTLAPSVKPLFPDGQPTLF